MALRSPQAPPLPVISYVSPGATQDQSHDPGRFGSEGVENSRRFVFFSLLRVVVMMRVGVVMRLAGKIAEPGIFSSHIQRAPADICTHRLSSHLIPPLPRTPGPQTPHSPSAPGWQTRVPTTFSKWLLGFSLDREAAGPGAGAAPRRVSLTRGSRRGQIHNRWEGGYSSRLGPPTVPAPGPRESALGIPRPRPQDQPGAWVLTLTPTPTPIRTPIPHPPAPARQVRRLRSQPRSWGPDLDPGVPTPILGSRPRSAPARRTYCCRGCRSRTGAAGPGG